MASFISTVLCSKHFSITFELNFYFERLIRSLINSREISLLVLGFLSLSTN